MPDMLVKLYDLPRNDYEPALNAQGIAIKRAMAADTNRVLEFVRQHFHDGWANECACALASTPARCYIAVQGRKVVGFACYDVAALNFFGPIGVDESMRGKKVGAALLRRCLHTMKEMGYGYAIIGWVGDAQPFYEKEVSAQVIAGSFPGQYANMIDAQG
ncbi:MAG: GNAT family N-acetyltransferase [Eubacteriales bacterium]|nr:GNAT family N-acetyltransferase [Eubacteriales bacterium]